MQRVADGWRPAAGGPTVVYIVGVGRSGTTLLERALGAIPGWTNCGELIGLFPRVAPQDQRCGCGVPFSRCPFWLAVGRRAFQGWRDEEVERIAKLQTRVVRQRHLCQLAATHAQSSPFRARLEEYLHTYVSLYRAVGAQSGASVIVDASKSPAQLLAMRRSHDLDLRVLNLVRDPRGVVYSWTKPDLHLPHAHSTERVMRTYTPRRSTLLWSAFQVEASLLVRTSRHAAVMRYEDLVASPRETILAALDAIELPTTTASLNHISDGAVTLPASHGVAGSRSRFATGRVSLHSDDGWRTNMPMSTRRFVTALTLPQRLGYGYSDTPSARAA